MNFRNFIYVTTCLSFSIIIGAAVYEHTALWPNAFSAVPGSLSVFQGPYKLNPAAFWMPIHPVTLVLFTITLVTTWKTQRRKNVLVPMTGYVLALIITISFFVPELLDLTGTPFSNIVDASRTERADRWVTLSLIRGGVLFVLALILFSGLTKAEHKEV